MKKGLLFVVGSLWLALNSEAQWTGVSINGPPINTDITDEETLFFDNRSQSDFRFADSTAQWNVLGTTSAWCLCLNYGTEHFAVAGDTVIGNKQFQNLQTAFIRKDSTGKVYKHNSHDTIEYLIYDFSKQAGDT